LVSALPKVSIFKLMGILKGKLAIKIFNTFLKLKVRSYWGYHFWARESFVSSIGLDKDMIRK